MGREAKIEMNSLQKAKFWKEFIYTKCNFPNIKNLRNHFENAHFSEFCECGCNSFKVEVNREKVQTPLAKRYQHARAIFEACYTLEVEEKSLEIVLHTDKDGYLSYVNVDCCANTFPVPDIIKIKDKPYNEYISKDIILDKG